MSTGPFSVRNGWSLYPYPAFGDAFERLQDAVEDLKKKHPANYEGHPKAKLLRRILELILDEIPRDPNAAAYQLGNTLGPAHRHWRRAKFLGRFRLFYRFSAAHKAIVYAWVNDETTSAKPARGQIRTRSSTNDCATAILRTIGRNCSARQKPLSHRETAILTSDFWSVTPL